MTETFINKKYEIFLKVLESGKMNKKKICPHCGGEVRLDPSSKEYTCTKCGYVIDDEYISYGQEGRVFSGDQGKSTLRTGVPLSDIKHDKGMSTTIGMGRDMYNTGDSKKINRLKKWQTRISTALERNIKYALSELRRVSENLNLGRATKEEASRIYRRAAEQGLVRGRSMESVVAGALYAACRIHRFPRTLDEISEAFGLDKKEIGKTYRFICRELKIRILPTFPKDYVYRFSNELGLSPKTTTKALEIIEKAQEKEITSGKGPMGVAAAALYVATLICNEKKTQREVADVAGVTEVTIRNRYKELIEKLDLEKEIQAGE